MSQKKNKQTKDQYINVPIWLTKLTGKKESAIHLTPLQLNLYCLIKGLSENKPCYATNDYFHKIFKVSIVHISNCITELNNKGFIKTEHLKGNQRLIYTTDKLKKGCMFIVYDEENQSINITTENKVYKFNWDKWSSLVFEDGKNYDPLLLEKLI